MAENNISNVMKSLFEGMNAVISTKTVVGEPTVIGDTTIIPLMDVSFGCGAGAGLNEKKNGGTGGFFGKETPNSVLVIKNGQVKLVSVKNQDTITKILDLVPELVDRFTTPKEEMISDEAAKDIAFGEDAD
ncbi:MAG: GerW family sporulation protein [Lachnospiraceae bacterium]|nr:GerW family sporulation protein [Lachnospiraceae bacterium]